MSTSISEYVSSGWISKHFGFGWHQTHYAIGRLGIEPVAVIGGRRLFDPGVVEQIGTELRSIAARKRKPANPAAEQAQQPNAAEGATC